MRGVEGFLHCRVQLVFQQRFAAEKLPVHGFGIVQVGIADIFGQALVQLQLGALRRRWELAGQPIDFPANSQAQDTGGFQLPLQHLEAHQVFQAERFIGGTVAGNGVGNAAKGVMHEIFHHGTAVELASDHRAQGECVSEMMTPGGKARQIEILFIFFTALRKFREGGFQHRWRPDLGAFREC